MDETTVIGVHGFCWSRDKTKKEEIREGIKERIKAYAYDLHPSDVECNEMAKLLLMFLHLQGVVIKVDRELPESEHTVKGEHAHGYYEYVQEDMIEAGYVAVESLI